MASWVELLSGAEPGEHVVQLYGNDDQLLIRNVSRYLAEGLRRETVSSSSPHPNIPAGLSGI